MNSLHFLLGQLLIVAVVIWAIREEKAKRGHAGQPPNASDASKKRAIYAKAPAQGRPKRDRQE